MSSSIFLGLISSSLIFNYLFSLTPLTHFLPQIIALYALISFYFLKTKNSQLFQIFITSLASLIVFSTTGLNSPFFFLVYFLLFLLAFQNPPLISLSLSLILIFLLSQSLNSLTSLIPLLSLLFITPLVWFISREYLENRSLSQSLQQEETDSLLWLDLKLKPQLHNITDLLSQVVSDPKLPPSHHQAITRARQITRRLLKSANNLSQEIDELSDD
jgi:hypothetical protein